jgi:hypothetical protein
MQHEHITFDLSQLPIIFFIFIVFVAKKTLILTLGSHVYTFSVDRVSLGLTRKLLCAPLLEKLVKVLSLCSNLRLNGQELAMSSASVRWVCCLLPFFLVFLCFPCMLPSLDVVHPHACKPLVAEVLVLKLVLVVGGLRQLFSMKLKKPIHWNMVREGHIELGIVLNEFGAPCCILPKNSVCPGGHASLFGSIVDQGSFVKLESWWEIYIAFVKVLEQVTSFVPITK